MRSTQNIVEEIEEIIVTSPELKAIFLEVETIDINRKWALELCERLQRLNKKLRHPVSFETNLRITPRADQEELFMAMKKSNFHMVYIGLESGSEKLRQKVLRRNYSNRDIIHAVRVAKKFGLKVLFYVMIGIPGETLADFEETVKICRICLPDTIARYIFFPYPKTDLYEKCKREGLLRDFNIASDMVERKEAVFDLFGFNKKQIELAYNFFNLFVYKGFSTSHLKKKRFIETYFYTMHRLQRRG